jgi:uncharacterized membrane protein YdjX (TVP38/TMEM64 family)
MSGGTRRWAVIVAIAVVGVVTVYMTATGALTADGVRRWLESLGPWGPLLFVVVFVLGSMVGLPGMAFVIGARLAFGPWLGFALGYGGGVLAIAVPFLSTRALRRADVAPWRPRGPRVGRLFAQLESRPIAVVAALRLILWFNAAVTYALAMSGIRTRDYLIGSAAALLPVVAAANFVSGWLTS